MDNLCFPDLLEIHVLCKWKRHITIVFVRADANQSICVKLTRAVRCLKTMKSVKQSARVLHSVRLSNIPSLVL